MKSRPGDSGKDKRMPVPIKWKPDFELVNLENPEGEPWLSASPDGRFSLVFYETLAGPPVHTDLEERIYTAAGLEQTAIGTTFSATTNEHQAASAYLADGRRVYVWTEEPEAGGGNLEDVYAEVRFGINIIDVARFLVSGGAGRQHDPIVAANSTGFAVAMVDNSVAGGQLILKFYNIAGTLINTVNAPNAPQTVALGGADQYRDVEITSLANGNYVIVWDSQFNADVFARVYSSGGAAQSGVIVVQTGAPGAGFPDVTELADGRFVVTYAEFVSGNVRGSMFNPDGTPDGASFAIGSGSANDTDNQVQTAALNDGRFVTVWKTTAGEIAGQVMFADGTPDGAAFTVNTVTAGDQSRPTIAVLADGRFAVSWESGAGAAPETIITTIFDPREEGINIGGTTSADDYIGSGFADTISTGLGNDRVDGAGGNDFLSGGQGIDILVGGSGHDRLDGGSSADTMIGGLDNDIYIVDSAADVVTERSGAGTGADFINSSVTLTMAANTERLFLTGNANINGTGINGQVDVLTGNSGHNILNGLTGNDVMRGGLGHDTYIVDSTSDVVEEVSSAGTDSIKTTATFTMTANTERLYLVGSGVIDGTGLNGGGELIVGNNMANRLNGLSGNDTLTGGLGADTFVFNTALSAAANHDTVTDFIVADDTINLENAIFALLIATGALASNLFEDTSIAGQNGSEVVIYDKANGDLYYDTNGAATAGGLVLFADVTNNTALTAADFVVV